MKKLVVILFTLLVILPFISSAPPVTVVSTGDNSLELKTPPINCLKENENFEFEIHVYNKSTGFPLTSGVSCYLHLYNSSGKHIYEGFDSTISHDFDYSFDVAGGNFTKETRGYVVACNTSTQGGFADIHLDVNKSGADPDGITKALFSLLFIFICFEMLGLLLWTILHFLELNLDAKDLILNVSSYFALFAIYILQLRFVGDIFMSDFLVFLLEVGALTTVLLPIIGFVVSYIKQNMKKGDHNG